VNCQQCRAANALYFECLKGQLLATFDAELQQVIEAWDWLHLTTRRAIVTYVQAKLPVAGSA
jgi:hypothetical protein